MEIHKNDSPPFLTNKKALKFIILAILLIVFALSMFVLGGVVQKKGVFSNIRNSLRPNVPFNYLKGKLTNTAETIFIDIKFKNLLKLQEKRKEALNSGVLISDEYVPGNITIGEDKYKVKMRLKGDLTDHLEGNKWSFRIKVKGENTIFGMKQFSIHHPKARNNIYEYVFHKFLKKEGLVALRYKFVKVILNGENLGIYAVEEHFEKRLVEHNNRKSGPLIRFNEELYWERFKIQSESEKYSFDYGRILSSNIDAFKTNDILTDSIEFQNFSKAMSLLESFRMGKKSTSEIFDIELLSAFYAMIDLFGANHSLYYQNLRYYYNPITAYLEPVGFDGFHQSSNNGHSIKFLVADVDNKISKSNDTGIRDYVQLLFNDEKFYRKYIKKLARYSERGYLDSAFKYLDEEIDENLNILNSEWPYLIFNKETIYGNQNFIKQSLNPPKAIHAYLKLKNNEKIRVSISSIQLLPVKINNLILNDSLIFLPSDNNLIPGKNYDSPVDFFIKDFAIPSDLDFSKNDSISLKISYQIAGTNNPNIIDVFPWDNYKEGLVTNDFIRKEDDVYKFKFITKNEDNKHIVFKSGIHNIEESIHIPSGYEVIIPEGTSLNLINKASIISKSPVFLRGSEERPILVTSSDSTGQGLFVLKANKRSIMNHVIFENLSSPSKNSWSLTGAITFYESDISIDKSRFINNIRGDDYLNIVRSDFSINNSRFVNVKADAFDADFSFGEMNKNIFKNCGNDGIDISGTKMVIENILMDNIGDKALSSGEMSDLTAKNIEIRGSEIAICAKDNSVINISNAFLHFNKIAITAFQKKPEFGPAQIIGSNVEITNAQNSFLIESKSKLILDGNEIKSNNERVKDLLYGVIYGKSSK